MSKKLKSLRKKLKSKVEIEMFSYNSLGDRDENSPITHLFYAYTTYHYVSSRGFRYDKKISLLQRHRLTNIFRDIVSCLPVEKRKPVSWEDTKPRSTLFWSMPEEIRNCDCPSMHLTSLCFTIKDAADNITFEMLRERGVGMETIAKLQVISSEYFGIFWPATECNISVNEMSSEDEGNRNSLLASLDSMSVDKRRAFLKAYSLAFEVTSTDGDLEELINNMSNAHAAQKMLIEN